MNEQYWNLIRSALINGPTCKILEATHLRCFFPVLFKSICIWYDAFLISSIISYEYQLNMDYMSLRLLKLTLFIHLADLYLDL